ncbi:MAG: ATP-binding protein [Alphaproteobacteria bacterium]|nr:ATP-binding protein [Alphaproteobacteria bacterium]
MPSERDPAGRSDSAVPTTMVIAAPGVIVLGFLAATGLLTPLPAILAAAVVLAGAVFLAGRLRRALASVRAFVDRLSSAPDSLPPKTNISGLTELVSAVVRLSRSQDRERQAGEERFHAVETIFDGLPDPVATLDQDCRLLSANAAAQDRFGDHIIGLDLGAALRHPGLRDAAIEVIALGAKNKQARREVEFSVAGAVVRFYRALVISLPASSDSGPAAVLALQDLTAAKRIDELRGDFVANVSHELKTPLSGLVGFIETLRGPAAGDEKAREEFLDIMDQQAARMSGLIKDLLSLSAIEANEHLQPIERIDLLPVVRRSIRQMEGRAKSRGVKLSLMVAEDLPQEVMVIGDLDQIAQVFENLIDNAIKYSPQSGEVRVAMRRARGAVPSYAVEIADQGEGIAPEHVPRLTERFYRVDPARSRQLGGTGLGLAIVKHILNRHQGSLHISSTPGEGSRFTVRLPTAPESS